MNHCFSSGQCSGLDFFSFSCRSCARVCDFKLPFGKIFLGDAGAGALGHLLVWSAIFLVNHATELSPFAILLIFFGQLRILVWLFGDVGNWEILLIVQIDSTSISLVYDFLKSFFR